MATTTGGGDGGGDDDAPKPLVEAGLVCYASRVEAEGNGGHRAEDDEQDQHQNAHPKNARGTFDERLLCVLLGE